MNEITAAIKAKAEKVYKDQGDPILFGLVELSRNAYTCGGEDAIGFMLKFVDWVGDACDYDGVNDDKEGVYVHRNTGKIHNRTTTIKIHGGK